MAQVFTHPLALLLAAIGAPLALALGLWGQLAPGYGVRVAGQRPLLQGLGLALILAGAGLGLSEPRSGLAEVPRLTVHVLIDASRSMQVADAGGTTRWRAAQAWLDRLWAQPNPGIRFSLDLLTGDTVPLMPPGDDRQLLRDALRAAQPGELGSPGTSMGRGLAQAAAQVDPKAPAILLLLGDGEETWESAEEAFRHGSEALRKAHLPLFACAFGTTEPQPVPGGEAEGAGAVALSQAHPEALKRLAEASGGRLLAPGEDPAPLLQALARGQEGMPLSRSLRPAHPEWGAWLALAGLGLWLAAAGKPMRTWRPFVLLFLALGAGLPSRAALPQSIRAWRTQAALDAGDLSAARRWKPSGDAPLHRLLAAEVELRSSEFQAALSTLAPLTGQGAPRPAPLWRAPALLMAARAWAALENPKEARVLLERLLMEQPGQAEAVHNLQTLLKDPPPVPPKPPKAPPPPPRPSQGARQDELEGLRNRLPQKSHPPGGVKDL